MSNDKYRILCTRPVTDSLIAVAGERGIHIDVQEFIQIKPLLLPGLQEKIHDAVSKTMVFTSANAVQILSKNYLFNTVVPDAQIACIAGNTKQSVLETFPDCTILAEADYGNDLADAIIQRESTHEVSFFCGNQRRNELPGKLKAAGIIVNEYVIYENTPITVVITDDYDGILFFSPSAAKSFFSANSIHKNTVCFAIGTTTAVALKDYTSNKIIVSTGTSPESMVQTAIFYFNNINCYE
ncbi:uroporphyrinogen-III synthase [Chitinophaga niastensis]|uniref:Uroporphyrinogen-III synthase n=1 Tax=Chitinophaga niastensis TaxID=536980 RepID=A0A2P8HND8_CHINA|nr:uroporphyrinogen-III synthase [Chitinophaga niastensis]PSL47733.1 uroporphyrinogen-III synthase [Chitinophaga niastensis]